MEVWLVVEMVGKVGKVREGNRRRDGAMVISGQKARPRGPSLPPGAGPLTHTNPAPLNI